ncbi:MAG TPA: hypothetical protein VJ963_09005 [Bacteroidales bacterium]|nr:hypothetical protein [Bacteroidales bacterium]
MKRLFILIITLSAFISSIASGQTGTWVQTNDGKQDCKKIAVKTQTIKLTMDDGSKKTIQQDNVICYSSKGKVFYRMPFYEQGQISKTVFMQLLKKNDNGLSLYKFTNNGDENDFVYKGDKLFMVVDPASQKEIYKEFGIQ